MNRVTQSLAAFAATLALAGAGSIALAQGAYPDTPGAPQSSTAPDSSPSSEKSVSDPTISSKVQGLLEANGLNGISIHTEMGVVSLGGSVASARLREALVDAVGKIDGVKGVDTSKLEAK